VIVIYVYIHLLHVLRVLNVLNSSAFARCHRWLSGCCDRRLKLLKYFACTDISVGKTMNINVPQLVASSSQC
jgi:hypothetical protein